MSNYLLTLENIKNLLLLNEFDFRTEQLSCFFTETFIKCEEFIEGLNSQIYALKKIDEIYNRRENLKWPKINRRPHA